MEWISNNNKSLAIIIPSVLVVIGGAWKLFTYFTSKPTSTNKIGDISTNGGDVVVSGTLDKSTTISYAIDPKLVSTLEMALRITNQQLYAKDRQINFLLEKLLLSIQKPQAVSKKAIELGNKIPEKTNDIYALSLKAITRGQYDVARQHLNTLIVEQESQFNMRRINLAKSFQARIEVEYYDGKYEDALVWANKWVDLYPNNSDAYLSRGVILYILKNHEKANTDFAQAINLDPGNALAYQNRGNLYVTLEDYRNALIDLKQAIALDPENAISYYKRGRVYFAQRDYQKALADYNQAITLDAKLVDAFIDRGNLYINQNNVQNALHDFTQVITLDPKNAMAYCNRGNIYYLQSDYANAQNDYEKSVQLEPNNEWYINSLVLFYSTNPTSSLKSQYEALSLADQWLVSSDNPSYVITSAAACAENNDFDRAISLLEKADVLAKGNVGYSAIKDEIDSDLSTFKNKSPKRM